MALPSPEDELTTRQLAVALSAVDITLADHVIIADGDSISMRMSGKFHPDDCRILI
jgi:DNA repair protein RadC